jgi:hypothetical protein
MGWTLQGISLAFFAVSGSGTCAKRNLLMSDLVA